MLTLREKESLIQFRQKLQDVLQPNHDDNFLLRWLRARDFNVTEAEHMLRQSLIWRENQKIDSILEQYHAPEVVEKYWPMGFLTYDKEGYPVWLIRFGDIDMKGLLYSAKISDICSQVVKLLEASEMKMKEQTEKLGRPIDQHSFIVDYDNFDFYQIGWGPAFQLMTSLIKLYEDNNYSERLRYIYGINTPPIFHVAFALIRRFYSDRTCNKMKLMTKDNWQDTVFEAIDESQIPAYLGGKMIGPDEDIYCTHLVPRGGKVPPSYYVKGNRLFNEELAKDIRVRAMDVLDVEEVVEEPGSVLNWDFRTDYSDIKFGLLLKKEDELVPLLPVEKVNSNMVPETGSWYCTDKGTYVLRFDNSFSWTRSKQVTYFTEVKPPVNEAS